MVGDKRHGKLVQCSQPKFRTHRKCGDFARCKRCKSMWVSERYSISDSAVIENPYNKDEILIFGGFKSSDIYIYTKSLNIIKKHKISIENRFAIIMVDFNWTELTSHFSSQSFKFTFNEWSTGSEPLTLIKTRYMSGKNFIKF